jgi:phage-related protein
MLIVYIDIPRVIRKGLHTSRTKVSQASYIDGEVVFRMLCEPI